MNHHVIVAKGHLSRALGREKAEELIGHCMRAAGLTEVTRPEHLLKLADSIFASGGVAEEIGRTLRIQAMLEWARSAALEVEQTLHPPPRRG
jgi:hypothetical protein